MRALKQINYGVLDPDFRSKAVLHLILPPEEKEVRVYMCNPMFMHLSVNHPPVDFRVGRAEVLAEDGDNHSLLRGAEVSVEGRGKDGLSRLDFRVGRVKVVEVDGHRDQCRDGHIPRRRCLGITDKRITRRGVLAAMGFLRGWGMF